MKERLKQLQEKLKECGLLEAQESNTAYEQAEKEEKVFKKEDDNHIKKIELTLKKS